MGAVPWRSHKRMHYMQFFFKFDFFIFCRSLASIPNFIVAKLDSQTTHECMKGRSRDFRGYIEVRRRVENLRKKIIEIPLKNEFKLIEGGIIS